EVVPKGASIQIKMDASDPSVKKGSPVLIWMRHLDAMRLVEALAGALAQKERESLREKEQRRKAANRRAIAAEESANSK
ncbi:MAG: hypothetical protein B7Z73_15870, partial [Planctomycetia bacterium 21-64-5]